MNEESIKDELIQNPVPNIFKIDHFYHYHRDKCKYAIVIESTLASEEMAKIVGAMQLRFEDVQEEEDCIDLLHLLKLLESYYEVKDVKENHLHVLSQTVLPDEKWERIVKFPIIDGENQYEIIQIDMYDARDFLCGEDYEKSYECLPNDEKFILDLKNLGDFYSYHK